MNVAQALKLRVGDIVYPDNKRDIPLKVSIPARQQAIEKTWNGIDFVWISAGVSVWPSTRLLK